MVEEQRAVCERFDVPRLDEMSREMKELAVDRLRRAKEDRHVMPPRMLRELSVDDIDACVADLRR